MSGRRETRIPILSMLDLLCGTFGAMIVVAMMLTFLRLQEPRFDQTPMYFVAVNVTPTAKCPQLDLAPLFIDFELTGADVTRLSPLVPREAPSDDRPAYHASSDTSGPTASVLLPREFLSTAPATELNAHLQNLPALLYDGPGLSEAESLANVRVSAMIQTAQFGCAVERDIELRRLLEVDASPGGSVSLFDVLVDGQQDTAVICSGADGSRIGDDTFEVRDGGRLRIPLE